MKINFNNSYIKWGLTVLVVICLSLVFYFFMFHNEKLYNLFSNFVDIIMPILLGLIMGYLFTPLLNYFETLQLKLCEKFKITESKKRTKLIRCISIIITWCIIIFIIYILIKMLINQIIPSIETIISDFNLYVTNANDWLTKVFEDNENLRVLGTDLISKYSSTISSWFDSTVIPKSSELLKVLSLGLLNILAILWDLVLGFIISIYVMYNKEVFLGQAKKIAYALFETVTANNLINHVRFAHKTFSGFIIGKIIDSVIIGLICFIGTTLLDMPFPVLISVVIGVTNIIPFFGPWFGGIPCAILILLVDITNPLQFVYFALFILFLQQLDGNVIGPKILGDSTGLSGFWVIFAIIVFGGLFGIPGMIIGVPTVAIIFAAITGIINQKLRKKDLEYPHETFIGIEKIEEDKTLIYKDLSSESVKNQNTFSKILFKKDKKKKK